jgi:hypothetical protein
LVPGAQRLSNSPAVPPASTLLAPVQAIASATPSDTAELPFSWDTSRSIREQILDELRAFRIDGARLEFRAALRQRRDDAGKAFVEILRDATLPEHPRSEAAMYLAEFDGPGSREALREALNTPALRLAALFAVQQRGDSSFAGLLLNLLEARTNYRIVEALGHLGDPEALPLLDRLLLLGPEDVLNEMIRDEYPPEMLEQAPDIWKQQTLDLERARAQIMIASGPNPESGAITSLYSADPSMADWSVRLLTRLNPPNLGVHLREALNHRKIAWSISQRSVRVQDVVFLMTCLRDRGEPLTPAESDWLQNWDNGHFKLLLKE